jgi:hypothetical protein
MKKTILVTAVLACSALWAVAQTSMPSSQTGAGQSTSTAAPTGSPVTVDGCLAGAAGSFTLKDKATGTNYNLAGDTSKLAAHVGHEVAITGTTSSASASAASGTPSTATSGSTDSASSQQTLNVTSAKMISSSCSAQ